MLSKCIDFLSEKRACKWNYSYIIPVSKLGAKMQKQFAKTFLSKPTLEFFA